MREAIVTLELRPGIVLDKATLTTRFGVSRFPVAEALNRLKAEGLVDIRPQSGSTVSLIRLADVRENMFLRRALEAETAALLAERDDAALSPNCAATCATRTPRSRPTIAPGFHRLDLSFHDLLDRRSRLSAGAGRRSRTRAWRSTACAGCSHRRAATPSPIRNT